MVQLYPITLALVAITAVATQTSLASAKKLHYIHWNKYNPMFRLDNTDHIVDINSGNLPWEYDQVNIICPTSKPGTKFPERHVIYSVTRDEFDSCRITNPKPKIVAICNQPHRLMYFTITFRSFTPTPGGLEFRPGQDYYFISTSSREDLHRRVGGGCTTNNMKMIFKVADNRPAEEHSHINAPRTTGEAPLEQEPSLNRETMTTTTDNDEDNDLGNALASVPSRYFTSQPDSTTTHRPVVRFNTKVPRMRGGEYIYYYHPRDLIELENNSLYREKKRRRTQNRNRYENEVWKNEALRYTSGGISSSVSASAGILCAILPVLFSLLWT